MQSTLLIVMELKTLETQQSNRCVCVFFCFAQPNRLVVAHLDRAIKLIAPKDPHPVRVAGGV